jgi:hypothetical protein
MMSMFERGLKDATRAVSRGNVAQLELLRSYIGLKKADDTNTTSFQTFIADNWKSVMPEPDVLQSIL